ncbi:MAG: hypothetical protein R2734_05075 [Nocardioides sp.]
MQDLAVALAEGSDAATALTAAARLHARAGTGPGRLLGQVRSLYRDLGLGSPGAATLTLAVDTWGHEARRLAAQPWCDPLTGLGTPEFFRSCLTTTYAGSALDPAQLDGWSLLTVSVAERPRPDAGLGEELEQGLRLGLVGEALDGSLTGVVAASAVCRHRVVVLLTHDEQVTELLADARKALRRRLPVHWVWRAELQPLPLSLRAAQQLLTRGCACQVSEDQRLSVPAPRGPLAAS